MYCKGILVFCLIAVILHKASAFPIGQSSLNTISNMYNQQMLPVDAVPGTPVITEIVPSLQFGDITVTGEMPIDGSIRVKGMFPVYGTVVVDGGLPTMGTAVVNAGSGVRTQCI